LTGQAASPGQSTGPARIVRRPEDFDKLAGGDVLVAPLTTPGWTPLFADAAAIITESGTVLAHAAVVAREYGLPAVVAVPDATHLIRDDEVVTVDGTHGTMILHRDP